MLDKELIQVKLSYIQADLATLSRYKDLQFADFQEDDIAQAAIERLIERIINRAIDINQHIVVNSNHTRLNQPLDYYESFTKLGELQVLPMSFSKDIAKSAGFRNMLVHDYDEMTLELIFEAKKEALKDYVKYCDHIIKFLEKSDHKT